MKKILLGASMVLSAMAFTANAEIDIEGTYSGELDVTISASSGDGNIQQQGDVVVASGVDGKYSLSIFDFVIEDPGGEENNNIPVGDILFDEVEAQEETDGTVTLSRDGQADGPVVYGMFPTFISLTSGSIKEGEMTLLLAVEVPGLGMSITVGFEGTNPEYIPSSLSSVKNDKITISSLVTDVIQVTGVESGDYTIYGAGGSVKATGTFGAEGIDVSMLANGVYFLKVDGASAKFIKK